MSIGKFIKRVLGSPTGKSIAGFALSEAEKAVAALKQTSIGAAVAADIAAVADQQLTGAEKFERVVANTGPMIVVMLATGGTSAVIGEVEDVARALVQSVYNDARSTKAATIAALILSVLKLG